MRPVIALLGAGLVALGIVEIGYVTWLAWLNIALGAFTFIEAMFAQRAGRVASTGVQSFVGFAALALWIIALATGAPGWAAWLNFVFGVAVLIVAYGVIARGRGAPPAGPRV